MQYKVISFIASLDQKNTSSNQVAEQLQNIITKQAVEGWEYVRLESVTTMVAPDNGCFGFGGKPGYMTSRQMIVFEKEEG